MKNFFKTFMLLIFVFNIQTIEAQFLKKLKKRAEKAAEKAITNKTEKKVYDETSKKMDTLLGNKKKTKSGTNSGRNDSNKNSKGTMSPNSPQDSIDQIGFWMSYDFVPGKEIIFFDNMTDDDYGDFPRRWDLLSGNAEIGRFGKERILLVYSNNTTIKPLFKEENYLPEAFTIEFDIYFDEVADERNSQFDIYLSDNLYNPITISTWFPLEIKYKKFNFRTSKYDQIRNFKGWHHISLSYHKGYLKMYLDEQKVLNIPNLDFTPTHIEKIKISYYEHQKLKRILSIKNFKIAKGGGKPYSQVIADGKFVTHGILFDINKANLKAQSSGVLKRVVDMLIDNPDWNFEIVGHTDSDGTEGANLLLSQQRAEAVKQALIEREIGANRLTTSGKGENEPLNTNNNPEEKANNRRVEFILKK